MILKKNINNLHNRKKYLYIKMPETAPPLKSVVEEGDTDTPGSAAGEHGKVTSAFGIFTIVVIIVLIAVTALFATNAIFFDRIKGNGCSDKISSSEADFLYWTNVVLAVLSGILALVAIIMLFVYWKSPNFTKKWIGNVQYTRPGGYGEAVTSARSGLGAGLTRAGAYVTPTPVTPP